MWQAALAQLAGSAISAWSQERTNAANASSATTSMIHSSEEAEKNRTWQKEMSDTAMQRQVADYKKAGINPLLGLGQGATTPGGATGSGAQSQSSSPLEGLSTSVKEAILLHQAMEKQKAEISNIEASTKKTKADEQAVKAGIGKTAAESNMYQNLLAPFEKIFGSQKTDSKNDWSIPGSQNNNYDWNTYKKVNIKNKD